MSKLISVIIPVYNAEKYLAQCLDSVLGQSYDNMEILLVNDGSTDGSSDICEHYADSDSRIKLYNIANGGVSNARNYALDRAKGDYIVFVDSDDYLDLSIYEKLVTSAEQNKSDIAFCKYYIVDGDKCTPKIDDNLYAAVVEQKWEHFIYQGSGNVMGVVWRSVFKKELLDDIRFRQDISVAEDLVFLLEVLSKTENVAVLDEQLYYYRVDISFMLKYRGEKYIDSNILLANELRKVLLKMHFEKLSYYIMYDKYIECWNSWLYSKKNDKQIKALLKKNNDLKSCRKKRYYRAYFESVGWKKRLIATFLWLKWYSVARYVLQINVILKGNR